MTLIKVSRSSLQGVKKYKNKEWEGRNRTPNEEYRENRNYRSYVDLFGKFNKVAGPYKFFEVRIVRKSNLITSPRLWFEHPLFVDQVFWMFQKPVWEMRENGIATFYVLEPRECERIHVESFERLHIPYPPLAVRQQAFIVPVDCCELAWTETANGVSEHLHYRPEVVKTQAQIDKEETTKEAARELLKESFDASKSGVHIADVFRPKRPGGKK